MNKKNDEEKAWPPAKRLAVLRVELEARLSSIQGSGKGGWEAHSSNVRWLAAEIWELEQMLAPAPTDNRTDEQGE